MIPTLPFTQSRASVVFTGGVQSVTSSASSRAARTGGQGGVAFLADATDQVQGSQVTRPTHDNGLGCLKVSMECKRSVDGVRSGLPHPHTGNEGRLQWTEGLSGQIEDKIVSVQIDSKIMVPFLTKEGGTRSPRLSRLTRDVLLWCREQDIAPRAAYVMGMGWPTPCREQDIAPRAAYVMVMANTTADSLSPDSLSRNKETEWFLSPEIVSQIFRRFDTPQIDLFASHRTHHLPSYMSLDRSDPNAYAVDALSQQWNLPFL